MIEKNIKGKGYSTVIIDTGADLNHPLFGADADNNGIADKIVYQYDFADNNTDASDKTTTVPTSPASPAQSLPMPTSSSSKFSKTAVLVPLPT